ncbi:hypothetical protein NLU13_5818 [Sarocladium strictum]|uniref:Major facilitator superfamily (MFS) profile domain-containing protein n=1 Tax=Sarocladium strictum TaxID=5046 RepID=A0AA39GHM0_SARSR|nr:hypothetical protein NLU13_5818 [Sarocladium strictum]
MFSSPKTSTAQARAGGAHELVEMQQSRTEEAISKAAQGDPESQPPVGRTSSKDFEPGPPPDGGFNAWLQAIAGHLVCLTSWGYILTFGIFQPTYVEMLRLPPSTVSWIGSIQLGLLYLSGAVSGRAFDAGFLKPALLVGCLLQLVGIYMSSISKTYWQLFLSQGVCMGIGFGLVFPPIIAHVSTYFSTRKVFAMSIAASGGATGGILFPLIAQQMLPKVGFEWTVRTMGLVMLVSSIIVILIVKTRLPPRRAGPLVDWSAFKELSFVLYNVALFFIVWALYFAFYYARAFAVQVLHGTQAESFNILMIISVVGIPGRMVPALIADRWTGPLLIYIVWTLGAAISIFAWIAVRSVTATYAWSAFFGFFSSGLMSLLPATATSLCKDMSKVGTRMGMIFTICAIPSLTGAPLAGRIVQAMDGDYLGAQIWGGLSMVVGATLLGATAWASRREERRARVEAPGQVTEAA